MDHEKNLRVRLPDKNDDEISDGEMDAEAEAEINERMKIKVEAMLRHDRMEKNRTRKIKQGKRKQI